MIIGEVVGTVVATRKEERLEGLRLQVVRELNLDFKPTGKFVIAVDAVGAGEREVVLCCAGSSSRMTRRTQNLPVDSVIMAIVDAVEVGGKLLYEKKG